MASTRLVDATRWLRQHSASERSFASALNRHFREQAERVAEDVQDYAWVTPEMVPSIFKADVEHERLMPLIRRNLGALMVIGAQDELTELDGKSAKQIDDDYLNRFDLDLGDLLQLNIEAIPISIRNAIRAAVDLSAAQPYWRAIQDGVQGDIASIIKTSIDAGDSGHTMATRIREELGGEWARKRSKVISRTETTGALNNGHDLAITEIAQSGEPIKKQWLSIIDDDTRQSHVDADGQIAQPNGNFIIGGYEAAFPGAVSLPISERANCRCVCIGSFA